MTLTELTDAQLADLRASLTKQLEDTRTQLRAVVAEHNVRLRKEQIGIRWGAAGRALLSVMSVQDAMAVLDAEKAKGLASDGTVIAVDKVANVSVNVDLVKNN